MWITDAAISRYFEEIKTGHCNIPSISNVCNDFEFRREYDPVSNSMTAIDNLGELPEEDASLRDVTHREETQLDMDVCCVDEDALFVIAGQLREKVRAITLELGLSGATAFGTAPAVANSGEVEMPGSIFCEPANSAAVYVDDPDQT